MKRNLFLAVLIGFLLGVGATKIVAHPTLLAFADRRATELSPPVALTAPSRPASEIPLMPSAAISAVLKPESSPKFNDVRSSAKQPGAVVSNPVEARLSVLLESQFPQGRQILRNDKDDGGVATFEQTDDGSSISRIFSSKGELRSEGLVSMSGEQVDRSYFDSGKLRGFSWIRPDGFRIDIKMTGEGLYEGRQDTLINGEKIITKYDESGQVRERWRMLKSGRHVSI